MLESRVSEGWGGSSTRRLQHDSLTTVWALRDLSCLNYPTDSSHGFQTLTTTFTSLEHLQLWQILQQFQFEMRKVLKMDGGDGCAPEQRERSLDGAELYAFKQLEMVSFVYFNTIQKQTNFSSSMFLRMKFKLVCRSHKVLGIWPHPPTCPAPLLHQAFHSRQFPWHTTHQFRSQCPENVK